MNSPSFRDLNAVSVIIGPNGSGKSRKLREVCIDALNEGKSVIAIAPTIYDRFQRIRQSGFSFFGARLGRNAAAGVIRETLAEVLGSKKNLFRNLTVALRYTNFDPAVGMKVPKIQDGYEAKIAEFISDEREAGDLMAAFSKWQEYGRHEETGIVRLTLDDYSFRDLDSMAITVIAKYEKVLRRIKVIPKIEYFLFRKGEPIPLLEACSGELCFITTMAFITSKIEPGSIILIDEPENSLHPTWQKSYIQTLLDLFHRYQPRIVVSTHSPIIISGGETSSENVELSRDGVTVYEISHGDLHPFPHTQYGLEEMYDRLFGLITPKNHYVSRRSVELLNELNSGERGLEGVLVEFDALKEKSYDGKQIQVIGKIKELAKRVQAERSIDD